MTACAAGYVHHVDGLRALVTNDDGIDSPGLAALASSADDGGLHTVVAAVLHSGTVGAGCHCSREQKVVPEPD